MGLLKSGGYILVDEDGHIALTDSGKAVAEKILSRHAILTELLVRLGVSRDTASADACKMEHIISDETFDAIKNHMLQYGGNIQTNSEEESE